MESYTDPEKWEPSALRRGLPGIISLASPLQGKNEPSHCTGRSINARMQTGK